MSTAYVSEMMTRLLGAGFVKGGTLSMAFIKPVYAGDRLTVHGVVKETRPEGAGTRVVVEVWCQNQHGEKTAVGTASGLDRLTPHPNPLPRGERGFAFHPLPLRRGAFTLPSAERDPRSTLSPLGRGTAFHPHLSGERAG